MQSVGGFDLVKEVITYQGHTILLDDDDYEKYGHLHWQVNMWGYACKLIKKDETKYWKNNHKTIFLHRLVNNTPEGYFTDHINKNRLDNRKCNLRTVTGSENALNRKLEKINKSGYRCVHKITNKQYPNYVRWRARATINKKAYSLGCFKTPEEAHAAYINFMKANGVFMHEEV